MAAPGFFFTGEDSLTPDAVDRKRILLNALRKDNLSTAPVQHWTQAAARVMGSLGDTLEERQLNRTEKQGVDENKAALLAAFGLGGAASPPAPSAGAALPASQPAPATPPQMAQDGTPVPPQKPASLGGNPEPTQMAGLPSMAQQPGPAALIRSFEGYRPTPYWDVNALRTGYGSDTITKPDGSVTRVAQGMQINRDDAERDLQRRISTEFMPKAASAVGAERWAALPPNAQAALTSVTYNYGSLPKSVAAAAQTGDVNAIAQAVEGLAGHNGGVNAGRRQKEAAIIRGGADIPAGGSAQAQFNVPGAPAQSGSTPQTAALLQALSNPWAARNPMLAQLGQKVLADQMAGSQFGFQVVGDQLYRTSPKTGQVELVPGPKSGNWSIIKDNNGNPVARMEAKTGEIIPLNQGAGGLPEGGPKTSDVAELRKEVLQLPSYKNLAQAAPIYQSMFKTAGTNSKASDLNLVYGLGKIMDPGSVVREGEMIMVKNTASLPDWLVGAANSLNGGQQLTPETRAAILKEAHNRVTSYQEQFNNDSAHYQGIASRNKMRTEDVIPSFGEFEPWEAPKPVSQGATPSMQPSPLSPTPQQQVKPPVRVNTPEEARKLPKGTPFITPDGRQGVIP